MKKIACLLVTFVVLMSICVLPVSAAVPDMMYAEYVSSGDEVPVSVSSTLRLNPENALGEFDAVQAAGVDANTLFYACASHVSTNYTFANDFWNVDGEPDIRFSEVTWGGGWHPEAVKVYLTGAVIKDGDGSIEDYGTADDEIGYYAGIAWNKVGISELERETRNDIAESYFGGSRSFVDNEFSQDGNFGITEFYLPDEVVYAKGITLVDITENVYDEAGPSRAATYNDATDGYDLDAIRVYRYIPGGNDSATGSGERILEKGTWFMCNTFTGETQSYDIQAGNPKDGTNIIGTYTVTKNSDGTYTAAYDIDDTITINGYVYNIVVTQEHLVISDASFESANPGSMDNADFGVPFDGDDDDDGVFYIFAHFAVEYK